MFFLGANRAPIPEEHRTSLPPWVRGRKALGTSVTPKQSIQRVCDPPPSTHDVSRKLLIGGDGIHRVEPSSQVSHPKRQFGNSGGTICTEFVYHILGTRGASRHTSGDHRNRFLRASSAKTLWRPCNPGAKPYSGPLKWTRPPPTVLRLAMATITTRDWWSVRKQDCHWRDWWNARGDRGSQVINATYIVGGTLYGAMTTVSSICHSAILCDNKSYGPAKWLIFAWRKP